MSLYFFFLSIGFFVLTLFLVFGFFSGLEMISWLVVSVACYLMALVKSIYAFRCVSFFDFLVMLMIFYMFL